MPFTTAFAMPSTPPMMELITPFMVLHMELKMVVTVVFMLVKTVLNIVFTVFSAVLIPVWIEDAAIASIMIQLQAEDLGLGSCWIQVRERFTATGMPSGEYVHTLLDIPLQLQVVSIIAVGHKGMERKPFNEEHLQWEKIHINKYGGK